MSAVAFHAVSTEAFGKEARDEFVNGTGWTVAATASRACMFYPLAVLPGQEEPPMQLLQRWLGRLDSPAWVVTNLSRWLPNTVEATLLTRIGEAVSRHGANLSRSIRGQVFIVPPSWCRPFWVGLNPTIGAAHPYVVCERLTAAAELLPLHEIDALASFTAFADTNMSWSCRVHEQLRSAPSSTLGHVCRALGVTRRTLQRQLERESSTYSVIRDGARLMQARMALEAGAKSEVAARAAGFATSSGFTRWKRTLGATPAPPAYPALSTP